MVLDLMRLPLGILSGMGFIGAGAIVRKGGSDRKRRLLFGDLVVNGSIVLNCFLWLQFGKRSIFRLPAAS